MTHQWHDAYRHQRTLAHHLDPRSKVGMGLFFVGVVLFTPRISYAQMVGYGLILVICAVSARVPMGSFVKKIGTLIPFILIMILSAWISHFSFPHLIEILAKSLLSIGAMAIMAWTTPFPDILRALDQLHFPKLLVLFLAFLYRYAAVVLEEATQLERAWKARYFGGQWIQQYARLGHIIASLFIRSYERAERVYAAMQARGFSGHAPVVHLLHFETGDFVFLGLTAAALLGVRWGTF